MSRHVTSTTVRKMAGSGMVLAALSIPVQIAGGADYPTIPPGLIILAAAAAVTLFVPWRWAPVIGFVLNAFISVGGALAPNMRDHLSHPGDVVAFIGTVLQIIGLVIGVLYGAAAILEAVRSGRGTHTQADVG
jgi:hypothetical protein